ncbi:hypothetical protein [Sinosporangium album]|nr:hypothetical protein [Sinosporangium album]
MVASGTAASVKLLIATLAFSGAYAGAAAYGNASGAPPADTGQRVWTVTLTSHEAPITLDHRRAGQD